MDIDKIGQRSVQPYLPGVWNIEKRPAKQPSSEQTQSVGKDQVSLSQDALMMQRARKAALEATDVRPEKVAAFRKAIEDGTYQSSNEEILDGMLGSSK